MTEEGSEPARPSRAAALTRRQRGIVGLAALAPVAIAVVVLAPVAVVAGASPAQVAAAALVYGGLVGLAAAFVAVARYQARQCPRCRHVAARDAEVCLRCGYDLVHRPRFACAERHTVYLDEGRCACGNRLEPLRTARGVGREVALSLKVGAWLLLFLVVVGLVLRWLERSV